MPYIKQEDRDKIWNNGDYLAANCSTAGELNYLLTKVVLQYVEDEDLDKRLSSIIHVYSALTGRSYQAYNDIMGAITGCKHEFMHRSRPTQKNGRVVVVLDKLLSDFYRKIIRRYEIEKISENGDVYFE